MSSPRRPKKPIRGTVCYRLFNDGLPCYTKRLWSITDTEASIAGVRSTGSRGVDTAMLDQIVRITIPLSDIIDIRQKGGDVLIIEPKHRLLAVELIEAHLTNWARAAMALYDPQTTVPVDDLRSLHEFHEELLVMVNRDQETEDRKAYDNSVLWGESMGEFHSYLRPERTGRPIRSSLNRALPVDFDLPEDVGEFGKAIERSNRLDEDVDVDERAFASFKRPVQDRPTAFDAIQELIRGRPS